MATRNAGDVTRDEIVEVLVALEPTGEAITLLAAVAVELQRRLGANPASTVASATRNPITGRCAHATTVFISPARFRECFLRRRIPLVEVGPLVGLSRNYGSVIVHKKRLNYFTADRIATALGVRVDDFIGEICDEVELTRLGCDG